MGESRKISVWARIIAGAFAVLISGVSVAKQSDFASTVAYFSGHKYILTEDYNHRLSFDTNTRVVLGWIELDGDVLLLRAGFGCERCTEAKLLAFVGSGMLSPSLSAHKYRL